MEENGRIVCVIRQEYIDDSASCSTIYPKGVAGLCEKGYVCQAGDKVHKECRKRLSFPKKHSRTTDSDVSTGITLRSLESVFFDFKVNCLLCGGNAAAKSKEISEVRTLVLQDMLTQVATNRDDDWGNEVLTRLNTVFDLPAVEARYHKQCSVNFRTLRDKPSLSGMTSKRRKSSTGRPIDISRKEAFYSVLDWLENCEGVVTISELIRKMNEYLDIGQEAYSIPYMKIQLKEHYQSRLVIYDHEVGRGNETTVTLLRPANEIISNFHKEKEKESFLDEKKRIISTAAQLILEDIKAEDKYTDHETYPTVGDLSIDSSMDSLPDSLLLLLQELIVPKTQKVQKVSAIRQAIMQAVRPRSLVMPLQIGLSILLHNRYASKYLIDILHCCGFASSFREVRLFEKNAAIQSHDGDLNISDDLFLQFVADNVDHDTVTIDGRNTKHMMGVIAAVSPCLPNITYKIPRSTAVQSSRLDNVSAEMIQPFNSEGATSLSSVHYKRYEIPYKDDAFQTVDFLWKCSKLISKKIPMWSGYMKDVSKILQRESHKTSIVFQPLIDLPPTDLQCVYSALKLVQATSTKFKKAAVCTFDQALWWKAFQVLNAPHSDLYDMIIRLGAFHTLMSFLGSIGFIMANTGLEILLQVPYAPNTVPHLLSGKAVNRAVRGHQIVDLALNTLLLKEIIPNSGVDMQILENTIVELMEMEEKDNVSIRDIQNVNRLKELMQGKKNELNTNRTAKLWLLYMDLNDLVKQLIRADRLGDWDLHLSTLQRMLPFFAATGHYNYTKSIWLYLEKMSKLESEYPYVYAEFQKGFSSIHRSKCPWTGVSPDLAIEQTLMRSLKSPGGLTRGTGFDDQQRNIWILSRPACTHYSVGMEEFVGIKYYSSDQHQESGASRLKRDDDDFQKVFSFLEEHNPFTENGISPLINIVTGVSAHQSVNVDDTENVGLSILAKMEGKTVSEFSFTNKDKAVNLSNKIIIKENGKDVSVDPILLFQRLLAITSHDSTVDLEDVFSYELSPYPTALFETSLLLRKANKPKFGSGMLQYLVKANNSADDRVYVIDGGWLLRKLPWGKGLTYAQIYDLYKKYVLKHFNRSVVVFDSYPNRPTTKDSTHLRRSKYNCVDINVKPNNKSNVAAKRFFSNKVNKQAFIYQLASVLLKHNIKVLHAEDDADLLTVKTAVQIAEREDVILVGEDNDLLALLCHYAQPKCKKLLFQTSKCTWDILETQKAMCGLEKSVLLLHCFFGCDTTSQIFNISKDKVFKDVALQRTYHEVSAAFYAQDSCKEAISTVGDNIMIALYKKKEGKDLNKLRHKVFMDKVAGKKSVKPEQLPPTKRFLHPTLFQSVSSNSIMAR